MLKEGMDKWYDFPSVLEIPVSEDPATLPMGAHSAERGSLPCILPTTACTPGPAAAKF